MVAAVSAADFAARRRQDATLQLLDVRTPVEFREVHVDVAKNIPLDQLNPAKLTGEFTATEQKPLYVICRSGARGRQACEKLTAAGWTHVINVEGGTLAAEAAGAPVEKGKKVMSLERQVRIAAGSLVFSGAVLAVCVHPYFVGLCAFVGAGLVFAGVTDTCGMGMMLAKMPWNQIAGDAQVVKTSPTI